MFLAVTTLWYREEMWREGRRAWTKCTAWQQVCQRSSYSGQHGAYHPRVSSSGSAPKGTPLPTVTPAP
jgi:hypothetical protein